MSIIETPDKEKKLIDFLVQRIKTKFQCDVSFIDLVSIEKSKGKKYSVYFFGNDVKLLEAYGKNIKEYFKKENTISLLFLKTNNRESFSDSKNLFIENTDSIQVEEDSLIQTDSCYIDNYYITNDTLLIEKTEEDNQINGWKENILKGMPIKYFHFSKIQFVINNKKYISAIWIGFNSKEKIYEPSKYELFKLNIENFIKHYATNILATNLIKNVKQKSLQSSIVSVLSRNGSHNIGSHVLNKLSNENLITNFLEVNNNTLKKFTPKHYKGVFNTNNRNYNCPKELIRVFNKYLKERMDFIADVATSTRAVIQTSKRLETEVFQGIHKNLLLLEHISGKGAQFTYKFEFVHQEDKPHTKDPLVSMPNDILGQQAFYIIVENIIRNTAKHSGGKNGAEVIFYIDVKDCNSKAKTGFYEISIYDNIGGDAINELVENRNNNIDQKILNDNNDIRSNGWGTIEMKLAAAYLSRVNIADIENEKYHTTNKDTRYFPLLKAESFPIPNETSKRGFGYTFYLKKPKEVLILDFTSDKDLLKINNKKLKDLGIDIISIKDNEQKERIGIDATNEKEFLKRENFPHHFLLIHFGNNYKDTCFETIKKLQHQGNLPHRVVVSLNNELYYVDFNDTELTDKKYSYNIIDLLNECDTTIEKYKNKLWGAFYCRKKNVEMDISCTSDYGTIFNKENPEIEAYFGRHGDEDISKYHYYEPFGSSSILGLWFNNYKKNESYFKKVMLLEAIETKVIIIDERIQGVLDQVAYAPENNSSGKIKYAQIFDKTNIYIPKKNEIDLDSTNLNEKSTDLCKFLVKNIEDTQFLVFHFGIIESLRKNDKDVREVIKDIKDRLRKINPYFKFILISGRGETDDIPKEEYFINFSAISQYTIDSSNRSKLHLTALLQSIRKKKQQH